MAAYFRSFLSNATEVQLCSGISNLEHFSHPHGFMHMYSDTSRDAKLSSWMQHQCVQLDTYSE